MSRINTMSICYNEGTHAAVEGEPKTSNPYPEPFEAKYWNEGFDKGVALVAEQVEDLCSRNDYMLAFQ